MNETVKVIPEQIPNEVFDTACRILKTSIRRYFEMPGVKEDYEKWCVEYDKEQEQQRKEQKKDEARKKPAGACR